jgi:hypothetical protein
LRILFFMRNVGYIRNFESVVRRLSASGHSIHVVVDTPKMTKHEKPAAAHLEQLTQTCPNVTSSELAKVNSRFRFLSIATQLVRLLGDYARYLDPIYSNAPKLQARARSRLRPSFAWFVDFIVARFSREKTTAFLNTLDRLIPAPSNIVRYIEGQSPDVVMVTPLLGLGSLQPDYVKACQELGVHSCLPVASWDNLTNKGLIHIRPDRVLVWNEPQKREAVELHCLPADSVIVTGAHTYDHWFDWQPGSTASDFKQKVGLNPDQPYVLFLGSSAFIAPNEHRIVLRWAEALRNSGDDQLKNVGILIRPHPQNAACWQKADFSHLGNISVYPRGGANAVGSAAKSEYYDSIFHCALVVGINTSGMIEAGILGKSVYTVLFDESAETQEGTLHFHHLTSVSGGLLHVARELPEHVAMLSSSLHRSSGEKDPRSVAFIAGFVRPPDLKQPPTEVFVGAIEALTSANGRQAEAATYKRTMTRAAAAPLLVFCVPDFLEYLLRAAIRKIPSERVRNFLRGREVPADVRADGPG